MHSECTAPSFWSSLWQRARRVLLGSRRPRGESPLGTSTRLAPGTATGSIAGVVYRLPGVCRTTTCPDTATEPLDSATVVARGVTTSATETNPEGEYAMGSLKPGSYKVSIFHDGGSAHKTVIVRSGKSVTLNAWIRDPPLHDEGLMKDADTGAQTTDSSGS